MKFKLNPPNPEPTATNDGVTFTLSDGSKTPSKALAEFDGYSKLLLETLGSLVTRLTQLRAGDVAHAAHLLHDADHAKALAHEVATRVAIVDAELATN